jgi:DNA-binding response OmpR family regulator
VHREQHSPSIFVLEDDGATRRLLAAALEDAGYTVRTYGTLQHARIAIQTTEFDLYLLDLSLPDGDGLTLCPAIRHRSNNPILILTMRGGLPDIENGLELGADDYVIKPFRIREIVARVKAQLRRVAASQRTLANVIRIGGLEIDRDTRDVYLDGALLALSPKEYDILEFLATRAGRTVSKDVLLDRLWGESAEVSDKILAVYIRRLRCKLEPDADNPRYVHTVRGVGYRLAS